jgi:predicted aconitase with swiveling domain
MTISAQVLVGGRNEGETLALDEPLSFSGGLDSATGRITDRWHPQYGAVVSGKVLVMRAGRGSSSGSAVLAEALRRGTGPAAILLSERDGIVAAGAIVASRLYGVSCPVFLVSPDDRFIAANSIRLRLSTDRDAALVETA